MHLKSGLITGVTFGGSDLCWEGLKRGVPFGGSGLKTGVTFGGSDLVRGVTFVGNDLVSVVTFVGSCLIKRGDLCWEWPDIFKSGDFWWEWPEKRGDLSCKRPVKEGEILYMYLT